MRMRLNRKKDRIVFRRTAQRTAKANLYSTSARGGIRL